MDIEVCNHIIGWNHKPFIIAEMSGNHNQSIDRALQIVDAAAEAGAHALKLQTYTADTMTIKGALTIRDKNSLWDGQELHSLYKMAYTPWEWHEAIFDRARKKGLIAFSSPFDETAVDFLDTLNAPLYKIASFENTHHPLLRKVAQTGKPVIMSTGVSSLEDILESINVLKHAGCENIILLKCTSTYPASPENSNLRTIPDMYKKYKCTIGLSDHTMGIGVSIAAVALGARVIEKHFTLNRADGGVDSAFSIEPSEMKSLVIETERAFLSLGKIQHGVQAAEEESMQFKRSIFVSTNIKKGEKLGPENLKIIRPSTGLAPKHWDAVVGKLAKMDLKAGTPLNWENIQS
jgi:pseudaminic acid synthase